MYFCVIEAVNIDRAYRPKRGASILISQNSEDICSHKDYKLKYMYVCTIPTYICMRVYVGIYKGGD